MNSWDLLQANMQFYQNAMTDAEQGMAALGMEIKSFFLLSALEQIRHPAELAKRLFLPKPTVSFIVKRLEKHNYLQRKSVPGDLRKFELRLTPKGRKAIAAGRVIMTKSFDGFFRRLSASEQKTYATLLAKLAGTTAHT